MYALGEEQLVSQAIDLLVERLPPGWIIQRVEGQGSGEGPGDALISVKPRSRMSSGTVIVQAKRDFAPSDVDRLLGGLSRRLREVAGTPILLVSNYLSPRSRDLLASADINYLDMAGNVRLAVDPPGMFVETTGSNRRPRRDKESVSLAGAATGTIIKFLIDVDPLAAYGVTDIEAATGVSRGYVSRILDRLADEAFIRRERRGPVTEVDWPALLRARASAVTLLDAGRARLFISQAGAQGAFEALSSSDAADLLVVTGSFAATRVAPVAPPTLLTAYVRPRATTNPTKAFKAAAGYLPLFQTDDDVASSADVALILPPSRATLWDLRREGSVSFVGYPQLAIDCLSGTGRMPAEGEAIIEWMRQNTDDWRFRSLEDFRTVNQLAEP